MKTLESLQAFEQLNQQELELVTGGTAAAVSSSNKKDVDCDSNDSKKKDDFDTDPIIFA